MKISSILASIICLPIIFTKGHEIVRGVNWFGFETEYRNLMCVWKNDINWNLDKMKQQGFNTIRLPFSLQFVRENDWENMDLFFQMTKEKGLKVVLDCHRLYSNRQSVKPFDSNYSFDDFLSGWKTILTRYSSYDNLIAVDIFNEYQLGDYEEWNAIASSTLLFLEDNFPERFDYYVEGTNWAGLINNVDMSSLSFHDRVIYSIHKYSFSDTPPLKIKWDYSFGDQSSVNIGEWGFISTIPEQCIWANEFVDYLIETDRRDTFFWTWSWNSGDTAGILKEDCETIDEQKMNLLHKLWYSSPGKRETAKKRSSSPGN